MSEENFAGVVTDIDAPQVVEGDAEVAVDSEGNALIFVPADNQNTGEGQPVEILETEDNGSEDTAEVSTDGAASDVEAPAA